MDGNWPSMFITTLCVCCLAGAFGAPYSNLADSAVPPGALKVHSSIVCEGQKAFVSCSSIFDQIHLEETMYGRQDTTICVHPSIPSDTKCQEQETEVKAQITGLCEGEHTCGVAANNNFMAKAGTTICPDVYKYLQIKYRCIPRTYYPSTNGGSEGGQSVSEVITGGASSSTSSSSSASSVSTSSSSSSESVPVITVQEHGKQEPVTTSTSQGSVTQIITHKGATPGSDVTEEFSQPDSNTDVITETFPSTSTASSNSAEVNETFKKSRTPVEPQQSGDNVNYGASASGLWDDQYEEQRDVVFDDSR